MSTPITVIVSGATGFIAQHVVKQLLAKNYQVIGTVRSTAKGDHLLKLFNNPQNLSYEIVEDVGTKGAFDKVLQKHGEAKVFLHLASPFHFNVTDVEKELLLPAVDGTKNVLQAIYNFGNNIEKVVITSSYAAISTASKEADKNAIITEKDWNEISWQDALLNPVNGYRGSKKFAEKAAWDFIKSNDNVKFSLSTINPSFVFGPQSFGSEIKQSLNTSSEIINSILKLKPNDSIPASKGGWVDVRDVAKAHIIAFENEDAKNQRILLNSGRFTSQSLVDIINDKFPDLKGKIPVGEPGSDKSVIAESLATIDDTKSRELLRFEYYNLEQSVYDTVEQIVNAHKL